MSDASYTVQEGDTFASVSKALYGDEKVAAALSAVNDISMSSASDEISVEEIKTPDKLWVLQDNPSGGMAILDAFQLKGAIIDLEWGTNSILAWDTSDKAEMKIKLKVNYSTDTAVDSVVLEVYQFSSDDNHILYKKFTDLKIEGNKLLGSDDKEFEFFIEWHDSMYQYGRTQYFYKLITDSQEKSSELDADKLLQLKYYDSVIANPSGDLPGASVEGNWVYSYFINYGPWFEAVNGTLTANGHKTKSYGTTETISMKIMVERNKFIHHQSSHGTAYCECNGTKNYVVNSGIAGPDGQNDYWCPVCHTFNKAVGCIFLKDWDNLFFISDVKKLKHAPKVLLLANCCLTAITDIYPKSWLAQGTQWYIGWALPVDDEAAVDFAKAFYRRWMVTYKMEYDKVRKAFNDVRGPYAQYRPRIFG
jgi:hypothetical protein